MIAGSVTLSSYLFFGMSEKTGLKFIGLGELISHETHSSFSFALISIFREFAIV